MSSTKATTATQSPALQLPGTISTEQTELAGRGVRLAAAVIDGLIICAASVPASIAIAMIGVPALIAGIVGMAVGAVVFCAVNYQSLETQGQTIGKRVMKIRIVDEDGNTLPAKEVIVKRYLPVWGVTAIPFVGSLLAIADAVLIFGDQRKCGHDMIAGTKVVGESNS